MKIKYTRTKYEDCVLDIDKEVLDYDYDGDIKLAIKMLDPYIKGKELETMIDDIEYSLSADDRAYEQRVLEDYVYQEKAIERAYKDEIIGGIR